MEISAKLVKELRDRTGAGMMECKKALVEAKGNLAEAEIILRKQGITKASSKSTRTTRQGTIGSYIHPGSQLGVLVEVNCESDFVARNQDFQAFVKDIAMQVAASSPLYLTSEDISAEVLEKEREIYRAQVQDAKKPDNVIEKIVEGKLKKFYTEVCLLDQPFVKDPNISVSDYLNNMIAKIGENMVIRRFVRFQLGEGLE
jgi:elongation factor Ts